MYYSYFNFINTENNACKDSNEVKLTTFKKRSECTIKENDTKIDQQIKDIYDANPTSADGIVVTQETSYSM